jgi:diadenosine tetraphosphate (Ap4A) HIT family hydrolase
MQDIDNTRSNEMKRRMLILREQGLCLFCEEGMKLMEKIKLYQGNFWFVTINDAPCEGAAIHVMAVPNRHITNPEELTTEEFHELFQVVIPWLRKELGMQGLSGLFRFGNTKRTGSTIHHLHFHFIEGVDRASFDHEPVWAVVGFKPIITDQQPTKETP